MNEGYDAAGAGDPALLFLHGWCGDRSFFEPQFDYFSATHRVLSVDLPGHDASSVPSTYEIESFASEVAALAQRVDFGRGVVIGHGLGAMVALALAWYSPEHVGAVAMIDLPPLSKVAWAVMGAHVIPTFRGPDGPAGRRRFVEQMFLPTDDAKRREEIIETLTAMPNDVAIPLLQAMARFEAAAVLRVLDVPVMCMSSALAANDAMALRAACPTIRLGQTTGAGHFPQLEVPDQVNAMIERFLAVMPVGVIDDRWLPSTWPKPQPWRRSVPDDREMRTSSTSART